MLSSPRAGRGDNSSQQTQNLHIPKFKFQPVLEAFQGEYSKVEIGRIYGAHHTTISKWKQQFLEHGAEVSGGNEEVKHARRGSRI